MITAVLQLNLPSAASRRTDLVIPAALQPFKGRDICCWQSGLGRVAAMSWTKVADHLPTSQARPDVTDGALLQSSLRAAETLAKKSTASRIRQYLLDGTLAFAVQPVIWSHIHLPGPGMELRAGVRRDDVPVVLDVQDFANPARRIVAFVVDRQGEEPGQALVADGTGLDAREHSVVVFVAADAALDRDSVEGYFYHVVR